MGAKTNSEFKIIKKPCFDGTENLEKIINEMLSDGWELAGNLTYAVERDIPFYLQPMIRNKKCTPPPARVKPPALRVEKKY